MYSLVVDEGEKLVLFGLCSHVEVLSLLFIGNRNYCLNSIETWIVFVSNIPSVLKNMPPLIALNVECT